MIKRFLFPIAIVVAGFITMGIIIKTGPTMDQKPPASTAPLVRTWIATSETVQLSVLTYGSVQPRTESELIPEVSGRVIKISPSMVSGGFIRKGEILLEIDPLDYEVALEQARASLAAAKSELTNAKKAYERLLDLAKQQSASQSQQDDALNRLRFGQASIREAAARLSRAERDISRTKIKAPYDGRVRSKRVDIGQFVNRGAPIASLYATDFAEVRLPLHDEELAHLDLPLAGQESPNQPTAILRARFAGANHTWEGKIVRTEGELDPKTRMINVVAQVEAPYKRSGNRPPLAIGLFVEAEIVGNTVDNVYIVPRSALQANEQVYVLSSEYRLQFRDVNILRTVEEDVYITSGFKSGETICLSTISNAVEGMLVEPVTETGVLSS
ncbi:MAG: efflux RND transporter periplasmic adaptor subunit [Gammaproteobacteria bacterium]|nr:efflux RND transporter periplasmic adaptor subunit [Gammaproteobacteria bacterium]